MKCLETAFRAALMRQIFCHKSFGTNLEHSWQFQLFGKYWASLLQRYLSLDLHLLNSEAHWRGRIFVTGFETQTSQVTSVTTLRLVPRSEFPHRALVRDEKPLPIPSHCCGCHVTQRCSTVNRQGSSSQVCLQHYGRPKRSFSLAIFVVSLMTPKNLNSALHSGLKRFMA